MGVLQASPLSWNGAPALGGTPVVKKLVRLDVPVDKYPNVSMHYFRAFYHFINVLCLVMNDLHSFVHC